MLRAIAQWNDIEKEAPELAAAVQARFASHRHGLIATLRRDGSPRLSGTETQFTAGGLWMGMMHRSLKAADLQRDPRLALHSAPDAPEIPAGDAKITGCAVEIVDPEEVARWRGALPQEPPEPFHLFRVDVSAISLLRAAGDHLVIEWWREGEGAHRVERR